ncbi:MAG TPA: hypothetical protein VGO47_00220 [Chlamydiales bacterium]|nr:hypothetical protein [Chlamydiales bacterium]
MNNQLPQVIDLNAASESCGVAELTNHTSQSGPKVPFRIHLKRDDDTPTGEMLITAKILKEPAQVDGAM